jgi:hypothetical protein
MPSAPLAPSEIGRVFAEIGAVDVMTHFEKGTLMPGMSRVVEMVIDACEARGPDAEKLIDRVVHGAIAQWADALAAGDEPTGWKSLAIASCSLAAFRLWERG